MDNDYSDIRKALYILDFESKILKSGCWWFKGAKNQKGYGVFKNPWERAAHRFSWCIYCGEIPKGMLVCHHCDNPSCVNPKHLFLGTPQDNSSDMVRKKRSIKGRIGMRGELNPATKITEATAREIISLLKKKMTCPDIVKALHVSRDIVYDIKRKKTWGHLHSRKTHI